MDELQQLLALMSAGSYAEGVATLTAINTTITSAQAALGTRDAAATLSALSTRHATLAAIEKAVGCNGDEAVGAIRAALSAQAALPAAQEELAKLKKDGESATLEVAIRKATDEKRCSPAIADEVRAAMKSGEVTLKGAERWVANLPKLPGLSAATKQEAAPAPGSNTQAEPVKHDGKTYAEMNGTERVALKKSDPEKFNAMRASAG